MDARLDRSGRESLLRGERARRSVRTEKPAAGRLHHRGLAREARAANQTAAGGGIAASRDRLHLPMTQRAAFLTLGAVAALLAGCAHKPSYYVYVSNEGSGDLTIVDPVKMTSNTVPIGKRARGIH